MCGNDGLQARSAFKSQTGTCNYNVMATAEANCKLYVGRAMDYINANAYAGTKVKIIANLYYPGYNADNVQSSCTDATTGARVNMRDKFLPAITRMNYWMCEYARQKGFKCVDNFAEYMGADYDSNGDGVVDSEALRYVPGESEASYVNRISVTLRGTLRDANTHFVSSSSSFDYIQSDNVHPTYTGGTVRAGLWGGTTGTLSEVFHYDSGTTQHRAWTLALANSGVFALPALAAAFAHLLAQALPGHALAFLRQRSGHAQRAVRRRPYRVRRRAHGGSPRCAGRLCRPVPPPCAPDRGARRIQPRGGGRCALA